MVQKKSKMRNGKIFLFIIAILFFLLLIRTSVYAKSDYVLPYPSFMPGSLFYNAHLFLETLMEYWYFGNFGQFIYNLKQSDKYLVEAKILFEYSQYLLGEQALVKSNSYFIKARPFLEKAKNEGKDVSEKKQLLDSAAQKHKEVLRHLLTIVPETFIWQPERSSLVRLNLSEVTKRSIKIREQQ